MRIEWTPPLRPATTRRDERGAGAGDQSFAGAVGGETAPSPAAAPAALGPVDGLLVLQEVSDSLTGRRRALARGASFLDHLEELRMALLTGIVPRERLRDLARLLRENAPAVDDPGLAEVLSEIELRVAVELAKLGEAV